MPNNLEKHLQEHGRLGVGNSTAACVSVKLNVASDALAIFNPFEDSSFTSPDFGNLCSTSGITFDSSTGRFTVAQTGTYVINANIFLVSASSTYEVESKILVSGAEQLLSIKHVATFTDPTPVPLAAILDLQAGDYVHIEIGQAAILIKANAGSTFSMHKIA